MPRVAISELKAFEQIVLKMHSVYIWRRTKTRKIRAQLFPQLIFKCMELKITYGMPCNYCSATNSDKRAPKIQEQRGKKLQEEQNMVPIRHWCGVRGGVG